MMSDYGTCTNFNTTTDIKEFNTADCIILVNERNIEDNPLK